MAHASTNAPYETRSLVPYFVPTGLDDEDIFDAKSKGDRGEDDKHAVNAMPAINERLDMDERSWNKSVRRRQNHGLSENGEVAEEHEEVESYVRVQVRDWDHAEGYFKVRTHVVKDIHTHAPTSASSSSRTTTPATPAKKGKKKKNAASYAQAQAQAPNQSSHSKSLPAKGSYAGSSFEYMSPAASELPLPTHLRQYDDGQRQGLNVSYTSHTSPVLIPAPRSGTVMQMSELEHDVRKYLPFE